jgi:hypothetical protein
MRVIGGSTGNGNGHGVGIVEEDGSESESCIATIGESTGNGNGGVIMLASPSNIGSLYSSKDDEMH